jgi:hypothetical protein
VKVECQVHHAIERRAKLLTIRAVMLKLGEGYCMRFSKDVRKISGALRITLTKTWKVEMSERERFDIISQWIWGSVLGPTGRFYSQLLEVDCLKRTA